ncbi:MAG TPA: hypothetical protein VGX93_11365, partial [Chthoniobacterales bacterium]|nr:hypothetical protein [Chthoniobacterales bacterium]
MRRVSPKDANPGIDEIQDLYCILTRIAAIASTTQDMPGLEREHAIFSLVSQCINISKKRFRLKQNTVQP